MIFLRLSLPLSLLQYVRYFFTLWYSIWQGFCIYGRPSQEARRQGVRLLLCRWLNHSWNHQFLTRVANKGVMLIHILLGLGQLLRDVIWTHSHLSTCNHRSRWWAQLLKTITPNWRSQQGWSVCGLKCASRQKYELHALNSRPMESVMLMRLTSTDMIGMAELRRIDTSSTDLRNLMSHTDRLPVPGSFRSIGGVAEAALRMAVENYRHDRASGFEEVELWRLEKNAVEANGTTVRVAVIVASTTWNPSLEKRLSECRCGLWLDWSYGMSGRLYLVPVIQSWEGRGLGGLTSSINSTH